MQNRPIFVGANLAATLPAALAAAVLVSAPFAGTTTTPLAEQQQAEAAIAPAAVDTTSAAAIPATSHLTDWLMLGSAEMAFVAVGAGVVIATRRRRVAS